MSMYTTELRWICEQKSGIALDQLPDTDVDDIIAAARPNIFDFTYPIFSNAYKSGLETKILEHFYTREIGAETYGLWKHYLKRTLREIMPYYNKLYESAELQFDPLKDVDYYKEHTGTGSGNTNRTTSSTGATVTSGTSSDTGNVMTTTGEQTSNTQGTTGTTSVSTVTVTNGTTSGSKQTSGSFTENNTHRDAYSATPESRVQGVEGDGSGSGNVSDNYYLTDYRKITDYKTGSSSGTETTSGTETGRSESTGSTTENKTVTDTGSKTGTVEEHSSSSGTTSGNEQRTDSGTGRDEYSNQDAFTDHIHGKIGTASYSAMLQEYRETLLNIDMMVINELEPLFMQIF